MSTYYSPAVYTNIEMWFGTNTNNSYGGRNGQNDFLFGYDGNDTLYGKGDDDVLFGGTGNDTLYDGSGNDILIGGAGADLYSFGTAYANTDIVVGFTLDEDVLRIDGVVWSASDILTNGVMDGGDMIIAAGAGNIVLQNFRTTSQVTTYASNTAAVEFRANYDNVKQQYGEADYDALHGRNGQNDFIYGGGGNDIIYGKGDDDFLMGDAGNDTLYDGSGNDVLTGGAGADIFSLGTISGDVDMITDFVKGEDALRINGVVWSESKIATDGFEHYGDTYITDNGATIILENVTFPDLIPI